MDRLFRSLERRYGAKPIRNAKVNSQLGQVVDQLGAEIAPQVAAFYCEHDNPFYYSRGHAVDQLLSDCAKLHTEWITGNTINPKRRQDDGTETLEYLEQGARDAAAFARQDRDRRNQEGPGAERKPDFGGDRKALGRD